MKRIVLALSCASALTLFTSSVLASPWVLPEGTSVIGVKAGTDFGRREFLIDDRRNQAFPLDGEFRSYQLQLSGRFGIVEDFELGGRLTLKSVNYFSEPVILPTPDGVDPACNDTSASLAGCRARNTDFSSQGFGFGDAFVNAVFQHVGGTSRASSNLEIKIPTGYEPPQETFEEGVVNPATILDDVALGDGRVHLQYQLELGTFIPSTGTVLELALGYRARLGAPSDQVIGELKWGQNFGKRLFVFIGADAAYSIFEGEVLGQTFVSNAPETPADEFSPADVEQRPFRLDYSFARANAGVILRLGGRELIFSASHIVWGENITQLTNISIGVILPFR